jgi:periplasmic protein TonB
MQLDWHTPMRSVDRLSRTIFGASGPLPRVRSGRQGSTQTGSSQRDGWRPRRRRLRRSAGKANRLVSNSALAKVANAEHDTEKASSQSVAVHPETLCVTELEHRYVVDPAGYHGKWDIPTAFIVALALHCLLFLGLWHREKVHPPSREMTVSIDYMGAASQGTAAEADPPRAIRPTPIKRKPTRTDAPIWAKPTVSTAQESTPATEAAPAAEAAPSRQMSESVEAQGAASSTAARGSTNGSPSAAGAPKTQSVLLSSELAVNCSERTSPAYPKLSLRLGEQGRTLLMVELDERGHVANVSVRTGSGFFRLDEAAVSAVKTWRCTPAMRNGVAVRSVALQPFNFALAGR